MGSNGGEAAAPGSGWLSLCPPPSNPIPNPLPEMGQVVCGHCRQLLSYPRGATHVQCSCCQTINFVLEAHQVGNVKCGSCSVLLMYPYGAPSVKCSSCHSVTEIGQGKPLPLRNPVQ